MYQLIDQNTVKKAIVPFNGDGQVNYSMLHELDSPVTFSGFSIKYVHLGSENYKVNGHKYKVNQGEYILGNSFSEGAVIIGSNELVKGVCININSDILSEVVASFCQPDANISDIGLDKFFTTSDFYENKYNSSDTNLGSLLIQAGDILNREPNSDHVFTKEFYYELCEKIVLDHLHLFSKISSISTVKSVTRKELFRKVEIGKDCIDNSFFTGLSIGDVAKNAGLSEYHFFRLFKTIYKISPHQYIIKKRLEAAHLLLKIGNFGITEAALNCGFSDVHSFSKSFKKHFGYSPSSLLK
ncbi:MAG: helix-turn-helix transcriptional regulator [bacterium]|nr:helix-turn-helix transcriptional regulator [bacterium]